MNCHGCKWLDEVKNELNGNGYCCMVVRSKNYNPGFGGQPSDKVRGPDKEPCELYESGNFKTRYSEPSAGRIFGAAGGGKGRGGWDEGQGTSCAASVTVPDDYCPSCGARMDEEHYL